MLKLIQGFKLLLKKVAIIQTRIILTIIYIVIVPIFAFLLHFIGRKKYSRTGWIEWTFSSDSIKDLKKQF